MAFEDLLDHTCDIYHIRKEEKSPGFNLPSSPTFHYPDEPDHKEVKCHFGIGSESITLRQDKPATMMEAGTKLTLLVGTDIRLNDKVVNCKTGEEYSAEVPRTVRNHHIFVPIKKKEGQKIL